MDIFFLQLNMFPLEEGSPVHQTQVCKKTINPVYHEIFTFSVREETLQESKLVVQVLNNYYIETRSFCLKQEIKNLWHILSK